MSTVATAPERLPSGRNENTQGSRRPKTYSRQILCAGCLILADLLAILVSLRFAIFLRAHLVPLVDSHVSPLSLPLNHYLEFGWLWLLLVLFLAVEGLYTQRRTVWNEIGHLVKAIVSGLMVIFAAIALVQRGPDLSRSTIVLTAAILLIVLPTARYWAKRILGIVGLWRKRILILGATDTAKLAIAGFAADPVLGYEVVGLLDDERKRWGRCFGTFRNKSVYVLGSLEDAPEQMDRTGARDLLIAMPNLHEEKLLTLVHGLQPACESLYVVPQLWGLPLMNLRIDGFLRERLMMLKLSNNLAKPWNNWLKRIFDLIVGFVITLLVLPVSVIIAVLIKMDSGGPVFFVQERLGQNGRSFRCIKFRSMHEGHEQIEKQATQNDVRIFPAGKWLRSEA